MIIVYISKEVKEVSLLVKKMEINEFGFGMGL